MFRSFVYLDTDKFYTYKRQIDGGKLEQPKSITQKHTAGIATTIKAVAVNAATEMSVNREFINDVSIDYAEPVIFHVAGYDKESGQDISRLYRIITLVNRKEIAIDNNCGAQWDGEAATLTRIIKNGHIVPENQVLRPKAVNIKHSNRSHLYWGIDKATGEVVGIDDVHSRGLNCNCKCAACNGDFIARKGEKNKHHFAQQAYILSQIIGIIDEEKPDAVLIAGDVYDKSVPSAESVTLFDDFLCRLAERKRQDIADRGDMEVQHPPERSGYP